MPTGWISWALNGDITAKRLEHVRARQAALVKREKPDPRSYQDGAGKERQWAPEEMDGSKPTCARRALSRPTKPSPAQRAGRARARAPIRASPRARFPCPTVTPPPPLTLPCKASSQQAWRRCKWQQSHPGSEPGAGGLPSPALAASEDQVPSPKGERRSSPAAHANLAVNVL